MLKKIAHIVISLFLFLVFAGISVNTHYCNGNLYSLKINHQAEKCCDNSTCGHCKNETVILKVHDDFVPEVQFKLNPLYSLSTFFLINIPLQSVTAIENPIAQIYPFQDISPPPRSLKLTLLQAFLL